MSVNNSIMSMKKKYLFILLGITVAGVLGCSVKHQADYLEQQTSKSVLTKALINRGDSGDYAISEEDLEHLVKFRILENASKGRELELSEIIPLFWEDEVCLYVLQYNEGYEVVSADKRSPIPIAYNNAGKFTEGNDPEGFGGHLNLIAEEIWSLKHGLVSDPLPESEEYIKSSLDYWRMVNADSSFIKEYRVQAKGHGEPIPLPIGHWEFLSVTTEEEVYDSIPHLTSTPWHQGFPFNVYCPIDKDSNNVLKRSPAGCVAIAGAMMLYYLHCKDGVPEQSPSEGSCTGYVYDNTYVQSFWAPSSSTWSSMNPSFFILNNNAALFIGDIGKKLHMDYHWDGSGAVTEDLVDSVFLAYGWNSLYIDHYDANVIRNSLIDGYPVVCGGFREARGVDRIGHVFLVDRYKRYRTKTTVTYEWVSDDPDPEAPTYLIPPYEEVTYSSPHISKYSMNWGQGDTNLNDVWCDMNGYWQFGSLPPYSYNREMIYNFTIATN